MSPINFPRPSTSQEKKSRSNGTERSQAYHYQKQKCSANSVKPLRTESDETISTYHGHIQSRNGTFPSPAKIMRANSPKRKVISYPPYLSAAGDATENYLTWIEPAVLHKMQVAHDLMVKARKSRLNLSLKCPGVKVGIVKQNTRIKSASMSPQTISSEHLVNTYGGKEQFYESGFLSEEEPSSSSPLSVSESGLPEKSLSESPFDLKPSDNVNFITGGVAKESYTNSSENHIPPKIPSRIFCKADVLEQFIGSDDINTSSTQGIGMEMNGLSAELTPPYPGPVDDLMAPISASNVSYGTTTGVYHPAPGFTGYPVNREDVSRKSRIAALSYSCSFVHDVQSLNSIRLGRDKLEKWVQYPFFVALVKGCFIRIGIGTGVNGTIYKVCEVIDVIETHKPYKLGSALTNKVLKARSGADINIYRIGYVSMQEFTWTDFLAWKTSCENSNSSLPRLSCVRQKAEDLRNAENYQLTEDDIQYINEQNCRLSHFNGIQNTKPFSYYDHDREQDNDDADPFKSS